MTEIKICGLTRQVDVEAATRLGVEFIGLVFAPSPRQVSLTTARQLLSALGAAPRAIGVFVDPVLADLERARDIGLAGVQVHGRVPQGFADLTGVRKWRGLRMRANELVGDDLVEESGWDVVLLDAFAEGRAGGTGVTFDWERSRPVVDTLRIRYRVGVAGGLSSANVVRAAEVLSPDILDVSSGVESAPGLKDHKRMEEFVNAVRRTVTE